MRARLLRLVGIAAALAFALLVASAFWAVASAAPLQTPQTSQTIQTIQTNRGTQTRLSERMINARNMFPRSVYDNPTTRAVPRAQGQARVTPHNNGSVTLSISASGLRRNANYTVYIDGNGVTWNRPATADNFKQISTVRTNASGSSTGSWSRINIGRGTYQPGWHRWSVFLNDTSAGRTVLVSDNLHFNLRNR